MTCSRMPKISNAQDCFEIYIVRILTYQWEEGRYDLSLYI